MNISWSAALAAVVDLRAATLASGTQTVKVPDVYARKEGIMETSGTAAFLVGRTIDCVFGEFVPRLTFLSETELQIDIPGAVNRQVVSIEPVVLGPRLVLLSWTEQDGTTVFHVHDYAKGIVHSHARLTDGTLLRLRGEIRDA